VTFHDYPVNYEKTLEHAKRQTEVGVAIESIDEIEGRWARVSACDGYSYRDIRKDILMSDMVMLLKCCVTFINKIAEQEELIKHRKPRKMLRQLKKITLPLEE